MATTIGTTVHGDTAAAGSGKSSRSRRGRPLIRYGYWWWALPAIIAVLLIHYIATAGGAFYAFTDWTGHRGLQLHRPGQLPSGSSTTRSSWGRCRTRCSSRSAS